ncbi:hypothetical protein D3C74_189590 [compost metagenome]
MKTITSQQGAELCREIRSSAPGNWTHDLKTIREGTARFVDRVVDQDGLEIVYFRGADYAGAWPAANWDRFAVARASAEVEQMTLF